MSELPDNLYLAANRLGFKSGVETYVHKFLRDMNSGPVVGVAAYDVDRLIEIARGKSSNVRVSTSSCVEANKNGRQFIDKAYAAGLTESDIEKPVIVIRMKHPVSGQEYDAIADGAHRLYRAWQLGRTFLPGVSLTFKESESCRLPDTTAMIAAIS